MDFINLNSACYVTLDRSDLFTFSPPPSLRRNKTKVLSLLPAGIFDLLEPAADEDEDDDELDDDDEDLLAVTDG